MKAFVEGDSDTRFERDIRLIISFIYFFSFYPLSKTIKQDFSVINLNP